MPRGLLGEAWDLIIDVHDVHVQLRGCSESLTISHFHDEMITVRKQPKSGRKSSFADTTTNEVEGVGEVSFPFLAYYRMCYFTQISCRLSLPVASAEVSEILPGPQHIHAHEICGQ